MLLFMGSQRIGSPRAPPLPRHSEAERSSEGPLLGSRVTPVARGPHRGGRALLSARRDVLLARRSPAVCSHGSGLAVPRPVWGGEAEARPSPPGLLHPKVRPARFRLLTRLAALPGPRWWRPLE